MVWYRILDYHELYDREKPRKEEHPRYPIVYWHPDWHEFIIVSPDQTSRLKAYIRASSSFPEVIGRAAKRGFIVYFQPFRNPFTNLDLYDRVLQMEANGMITYQCRYYNRRVVPAICLANYIKWPRKASPAQLEKGAEFLKKSKLEGDPEIKKQLLKKYRKVVRDLDPYPYCRRCKMAKRLDEESCLGVDFDVTARQCRKCLSKIECTHLMRLRIAKIMEGEGEEVYQSLIRQHKELPIDKIIKEVQDEMTKKKKEAEVKEVTEEKKVPPKKTETKAKAEPKKELSQKAKKTTIKILLEGYDELDSEEKRKARMKLRALGYRRSEQKK